MFSSTMVTVPRWVVPMALLVSCSPPGEEPSGEPDADVVAMLGAVVEHMNAEGDSVRLIQRVFCPSMGECDEPEDNGLEGLPELETVGASSDAELVFARGVEDLPRCNWRDGGGALRGFHVWFAEPQVAGDSAVVTTDRACATTSTRVYAQGDRYELVRIGPRWRVEAVRRAWET